MTEDELKELIIKQVKTNNQLKNEINEINAQIEEHKKSISEAKEMLKNLK